MTLPLHLHLNMDLKANCCTTWCQQFHVDCMLLLPVHLHTPSMLPMLHWT